MMMKKYFLAIVIIFFIMNIVIANNNSNITSKEKTQVTESKNTNPTNQQITLSSQDADSVKNSSTDIKKTEKEKSIEKNLTISNKTINPQDNNSSVSENNSNIILNKTSNNSITNKETSNENQNTIVLENNDSIIVKTQKNETTTKENQSYSYVNINELKTNKENAGSYESAQTSSEDTNETNKIVQSTINKKTTIKLMLFNENKEIDITGEIPINFTETIQKNEKILDNVNFSKEIIVKSNEHLESPLTVYSNIPETKKENIKLYWKNENKEIEIKDYIDKDNNGFIDRISWIVPHLSEQIFTINISSNNVNQGNLNNIITINASVNSEKNPIKFNFDINYTNLTSLDCNLTINNEPHQFNPSQENSFQLNLPNGNYSWNALCWKVHNLSNNGTDSGDFEINENFLVYENNELWNASNEKFYFLDLVNNQIKNPSTISINSNQNSTAKVEIFKDNQLINTINNNDFALNENFLNSSGEYILNISFSKPSANTTITRKFSVASANISFSKNNIEVGEEVGITVNINSPKRGITHYYLDKGESTKINQSYNVSEPFGQTFSTKYDFTGEKIASLKILFNGMNSPFTITKNGITVTSSNDTTSPVIDLIEPTNNAQLSNQIINFKYNITDNVLIDNCTFELYYRPRNIQTSNLNYSEYAKISASKKAMSISLKDFEEGNYTWWVTCYDNSSNENDMFRKFEIMPQENLQTLSFTEESQITNAQSKLDNFLIKLDSKDPKTKKALEDLGIYSDLILYQKRIQAIKIYFQEGYKTTPVENREQRKQQYQDELDEIKNNTPIDVQIINSNEFVKNSVSDNLKDIIKKIITISQPPTDKRIIENLANINVEIQDKFTATTQSKQIKINYENRDKELTLILRNIKTNEQGNTFFEYLPYDFEKATFITQAKELENNTFEINQENIKNNSIIYYVDGLIDISDIKKSETIMIQDLSNTDIGAITGFSIINLDAKNSLNYSIAILILFILIYIGIYIKNKIIWKKLKKFENMSRSLEYIKKSRDSLIQNNVESAKIFYGKIKEIYPLLPKKGKKKMQKDLKKIKIGIDKREVMGLVKEYDKLKQKNMIKEAKIIYQKIQKTYKHLPKKYKEKIYKKMFANSFDDFF